MEPSELLGRFVEVVEELGLPYLVTGSMATIFYGEPRLTADVDVVVQLPPERITEFLSRFEGGEFYVDEESARRAVARRGQFNIIHPSSGMKIDVMIPEGGPFDRSRFARVRRLRPAEGFEASFASPEDVILKKMAYYRDGGSEKHLRDIAGVWRVSGEKLDAGYLERWVEELGLERIWAKVQERLERS